MKLLDFRISGAAALFAIASVSSAAAQETIKIGIVGPFTGPFATIGEAYKQGLESFLAIKGNTVGGRKIELIYRDSLANPATAKQLTEELLVKDRVSILGGFALTPESVAAAPIVNEAKVPLLLFNSSTPALISMSPYFVRIGGHLNVPVELGAIWGRENGKSRGYTAVADYSPGHIVEEIFAAKFPAIGGTIVGKDRIPFNTVDYAPFAERVAAANPDILEIFIPAGAPSVGYIKALAARGLTKTIAIIGQGEAEDNDLHLFDNSVIGFQSIINMSNRLENPQNLLFRKVLREKFGPQTEASLATVGAYDGLQVAYKMIDSMGGKPFNSEVAMQSILGFSYQSPRGRITIDPTTRENIQDWHLRRVELRDGKMQNIVVKTFEQVKPPASK